MIDTIEIRILNNVDHGFFVFRFDELCFLLIHFLFVFSDLIEYLLELVVLFSTCRIFQDSVDEIVFHAKCLVMMLSSESVSEESDCVQDACVVDAWVLSSLCVR